MIPFEELSAETWRDHMALNLDSVFYLTQVCCTLHLAFVAQIRYAGGSKFQNGCSLLKCRLGPHHCLPGVEHTSLHILQHPSDCVP